MVLLLGMELYEIGILIDFFYDGGGISKAWIPENVFNSKIINNEP